MSECCSRLIRLLREPKRHPVPGESSRRPDLKGEFDEPVDGLEGSLREEVALFAGGIRGESDEIVTVD